MAQLAIYLDAETARDLEIAAKKDGLSRSAWVRRALKAQLANRLPESFFSVLGQWEDDRNSEEILSDIRKSAKQKERDKLE